MAENNKLAPIDFQTLCQSLVGLNTGFDFGPFQDPKFLFPLWNFSIYNENLKRLPPIKEYGKLKQNMYIMLGGCQGLGADAPPLEYIRDLGPNNASVFCSGTLNFGVYSVASHTLKSYGMIPSITNPTADGWINPGVSVTTKFCQMNLRTPDKDFQDTQEKILFAQVDINNTATQELNTDKSLTEKKVVLNAFLSQLDDLKMFYYSADNLIKYLDQKFDDNPKWEQFKSKLIDYIQKNKIKGRLSINKMLKKNIINEEEFKLMKEFHKSVSDAKEKMEPPMINWTPGPMEAIEPVLDQIKIDSEDVMNDFTRAEKNKEQWRSEKSLFIRDLEKLKSIHLNRKLLEDLDIVKLKTHIQYLDPNVITAEIAHILIQIYPKPDEIRKANRYAENNNSLEDLSFADLLLLRCLKVPNMVEILGAHILALTFTDSIEEIVNPVLKIKNALSNLRKSSAVPCMLKFIYSVYKKFRIANGSDFLVDNIVNICQIEFGDAKKSIIKYIIEKIVAKNKGFELIRQAIADLDLISDIKNLNFYDFDLKATLFIEKFKITETQIMTIYSEGSITLAVSKIFRFFSLSREGLANMASILDETRNDFIDFCKLYGFKRSLKCPIFSILNDLRILINNEYQYQLKKVESKVEWENTLQKTIFS